MKSYDNCSTVYQPVKTQKSIPSKPVTKPTASGGAKAMPYIGGLQPSDVVEKKTFWFNPGPILKF